MASIAARRQHPVGLYALTATIMALALVGVGMAATIFSGGTTFIDDDSGPGIGDSVRTSFGVVAVQYAERVGGLTAKQLGGMTHGIGSFVGADKMQIQATVTMTNSSPETLRYNPTDFTLVLENGKHVRLAGSSIQPGTLQPDAAIDARLTYVVPRQTSNLGLAFNDKPAGKSIVFDIGRFQVNEDGDWRKDSGHQGH